MCTDCVTEDVVRADGKEKEHSHRRLRDVRRDSGSKTQLKGVSICLSSFHINNIYFYSISIKKPQNAMLVPISFVGLCVCFYGYSTISSCPNDFQMRKGPMIADVRYCKREGNGS